MLAALWPLAAGHLLAMLLVILPFALLVALVEWQRQIQIGASLLVIGFGIFRLVDRRHPRALARIRPTQLGLWSFAVAIAHGAGLMLVPIYLGLCRAADLDKGHEAAGTLMNANLGMAVLVSVVHATAMIAAGGCSAWLVYRYLGLKFVSRSWFNLDTSWAVSLILVGAIALVLPPRRLLTLLMKMARVILAYELAARRQACPHILDQSMGGSSSCWRLAPSGRASPSGSLSMRSPRPTAASKRAVSRASSSCARTFHRGAAGRRLRASLPRNAACSKVEIVAALCSARV